MKTFHFKQGRRGFTLIELLLVIGIIAILAAIVIVAINPTKQLGDARDAQRRSDVNTVLNAVWQYAIDNNGAMPAGTDGTQVDSSWRMLGDADAGCNTTVDDCSSLTVASSCLTLNALTGTYVVNIPSDPRYGSGNGTATNSKTFYVLRNSNNRVTVRSCYSEQSASTIEAER